MLSRWGSAVDGGHNQTVVDRVAPESRYRTGFRCGHDAERSSGGRDDART